MTLKKFSKQVFLLSSLLTFSALANAEDLWIRNLTDETFSLDVNRVCQPLVISGQSTLQIKEFEKICGDVCFGAIYKSTDCNGEHVSSLLMSSRVGLESVSPSRYLIYTHGDGFHVSISEFFGVSKK